MNSYRVGLSQNGLYHKEIMLKVKRIDCPDPLVKYILMRYYQLEAVASAAG